LLPKRSLSQGQKLVPLHVFSLKTNIAHTSGSLSSGEGKN
jgi:hypothetical protein